MKQLYKRKQDTSKSETKQNYVNNSKENSKAKQTPMPKPVPKVAIHAVQKTHSNQIDHLHRI
jgi:hypothetical protein